MVIAALVSTVSHLGEELFSSEMSASFTSSMEDNEIENAKDSLDNREDDLWLQGTYSRMWNLFDIGLVDAKSAIFPMAHRRI